MGNCVPDIRVHPEFMAGMGDPVKAKSQDISGERRKLMEIALAISKINRINNLLIGYKFV